MTLGEEVNFRTHSDVMRNGLVFCTVPLDSSQGTLETNTPIRPHCGSRTRSIQLLKKAVAAAALIATLSGSPALPSTSVSAPAQAPAAASEETPTIQNLNFFCMAFKIC